METENTLDKLRYEEMVLLFAENLENEDYIRELMENMKRGHKD
jgi:hypothetical protein